jgi:TrmH family RNA methyltransferase
MVTKEISSVQHPLIKRAVALRLDRKRREQEKRVLVIGKKLIGDLPEGTFFETFFFLDKPPLSFLSEKLIRVSAPVLKKLSGLEQPDGWAAILPLPPPQSLKEKKQLLILDQVTDPGNLGTLWRTAFGLGWEGVWLTPGSVDPFNDKALRAAKGVTFRMAYDWITPQEILEWAKEKNASLYLADLEGELLSNIPKKSPCALILSNEGRGPSDWTNSLLKVTIPMQNGLASLNVASAGAILLYGLTHLRRR